MHFDIPGTGPMDIDTILIDLNGTLRVGKEQIVPGVRERLHELTRKAMRVILLSGDTRGDAEEIAKKLGIEFVRTPTAEDKGALVYQIGPDHCAGIGNGLIDLAIVSKSRIGIVPLQAEGTHMKTFLAADIVIPTVTDALDLFLDEQRLIATLRG